MTDPLHLYWLHDYPEEHDQWLAQNIQNGLTFVDEREDVLLRHLDNFRYQAFTGCK